MRISDWSSDVCSSDLSHSPHAGQSFTGDDEMIHKADAEHGPNSRKIARRPQIFRTGRGITARMIMRNDHRRCLAGKSRGENLSQRQVDAARSDEHTAALQSLMRISYAV